MTRRTWHHTDVTVDEILVHKDATGTTVSVVVPARNEQTHVGAVVSTLRHHLVDTAPVVDELLVVDGMSDDETRTIAEDAGATVLGQDEILPTLGTATGKGEALWKGLAATTGDLVVFVDADIVDPQPHFVTGLLGPLCRDPDTAFVKAAYDRPFGDAAAAGGGRVTELLARPLLATCWPELAWLAQPLAGEYAARRSILESVPFVQGYGVELALLVDVLAVHGPGVFAQVDLGVRRHEHQSLAALGRMATEILVTALHRRDGDAGALDHLVPLPQPVRDDGRLDVHVHDVSVRERPPLTTVR